MPCKKWHNCEAEINLLYKPKIVAKSPKITVYLTKSASASGGRSPPDPLSGSVPGPRWGTSVAQIPFGPPQLFSRGCAAAVLSPVWCIIVDHFDSEGWFSCDQVTF